MEAAHTGKVGRVVPTRRAGQEGKKEVGWLANSGSPHLGALGERALPGLFGARNFVGPQRPAAAAHARHFTTTKQKKVSNK